MIVSKKEFCEIMKRIEDGYKLQDSIDDLFKNYIDNRERDFCNAGSICIMLETPLIKVLETMFTPDDAEAVDDTISWWIYETEFGKCFEIGNIVESDGTMPDLSTAEKLYDYLVRGMEE